MASLLLKNFPKRLHERLKTRAEQHRRSMTQEAFTILETALIDVPPVKLPKPIKPLRRVTSAMIAAGIREGRA
jgi:plasmid stability protein